MPRTSPPPRSGPRTEWKLVLEPARAAEVFAVACTRMRPDPHVQDPESCSYRVESIYYDTPAMDCYRRDGTAGFPKYRARRYGQGHEDVYLEEKVRRGFLVWKRRISFKEDRLEALYRQDVLSEQATWFRSKIRMLRLRPTLLVTYDRQALVGDDGERVTIDRAVEARAFGGAVASFERAGAPHPILNGHVVELKYAGKPTSLIADLLRILNLDPMACSKYRLGIRVVGLDNGDAATA